jgi:hypothetical protein
MSNMQKTGESHVKLAASELPPAIRSGGENRPLEYPHLYQIQAGDWRISYAVEHNRLAILVLEVLNPDGTSSRDPIQEKLQKKMKIKLLDWPEGADSTQLPPEEISKKLKIKWLDMADEAGESKSLVAGAASRIKLKAAPPAKDSQTPAGKSRITLLDSGEAVIEDQPDGRKDTSGASEDDDRKVTPLDEPSM